MYKAEYRDNFEEELLSAAGSFLNKSRVHLDAVTAATHLSYMLYCSYVSKNFRLLEVEGFDERYALDNVNRELGSSYTTGDLIHYFSNLKSKKVFLPSMLATPAPVLIDHKTMSSWFSVSERIFSRFPEDDSWTVAHAICRFLSSNSLNEVAGRESGWRATSASLANLLTSIADVSGKSVLDFACGKAAVLSTALLKGASRVCGGDISPAAIWEAQIACFFGNPVAESSIRVEDFFVPEDSSLYDAVIVAPPLGMRLSRSRGADFYNAEQSMCRFGMQLFGDPDIVAKSAEEYCIVRALAQCDYEGMALIHCSTGVLFRTSNTEQKLRDLLVENGYIQAVVELPSGAANETSAKTAIVILSKERREDGILLVDMDSDFVSNQGFFIRGRSRRTGEFTQEGIEWLSGLLSERREIPLVSKLITLDEYKGTLSYAQYGKVVSIEDVVSSTRSSRAIVAERENRIAEIDRLSGDIEKILEELVREEG